VHVTVQRFRICKNTVERERKGTCSSSDFRHILRQKFVLCISKCFQLQGGDPPDPLTRGFAPGPYWGLRPQTPVIGSRSRARHERQRSGSFFVRTGSLQRSLVTSQPSDSRSSEMSNNNVSAGHAALRDRCRLSLLVQLTIKKIPQTAKRAVWEAT